MTTSLLLLLGCQDPQDLPPDTGQVTPESDPVTEPLDSARLLRRISLDLRGVLPSLDELAAVTAEPGAVDDYAEAWLADPRLEERLVDLLAERWLTRIERFDIPLSAFWGLDTTDYIYARSVGEEPLRLMAHVAVSDVPWSEIVTADYTIANEILAQIWPLDYPDDATGWQEARYTDGRPPLGVLVSNGLWWRYYSTGQNYNRSRAAAITALLLCEDYLERPIRTDELEQAVAGDVTDPLESPTCLSCHSTIDPLASGLFGFWAFDQFDVNEVSIYHPSRERLGESLLGLKPDWFGAPFETPAELGPLVAADPRLTSCAIETVAEGLWRRPLTMHDQPVQLALESRFQGTDFRMTELITAVLGTDAYRAGALSTDADDAAEQRETTRRLLTPEQLESAVADLTGFRWTHEEAEQLRNDTTGYRLLAGGVDGSSVITPIRDHGVTRALVIQRLAQAAAGHVVQQDLVDSPGSIGLLDGISLTSRPEDDAFSEQLDALYWRLYGVPPDETMREAELAFWTSVDLLEGPQSAWTSLISTMLRDPAFWTY